MERYRDSFHSPAVVDRRPAGSPRGRDAAPPQHYRLPWQQGSGDLRHRFGRFICPQGRGSLHAASELAKGMRIEHGIFGKGLIEEVDVSQTDHRIKVQFDNSGFKTLMLKFARFNILS